MGATIAPTKTDGSAWQPLGATRSQEQASSWGKLLKSGARYAGAAMPEAMIAELIGEALAPSVLDHFAKPRVYGTMKLAPRGAYTDDAPVVVVAPKGASVASFTPRFGDEVCFHDVAWHPEMRISVTLKNHHTVFAEEVIATVEVPATSLAATYAQGGVCQVPVGHEDPNVALLLLRVTKGPGST
jgi:hypothetical protein